jgi:hypothetical protein
VKRREQTPPILVLSGGSPAAGGRDNKCRRCTAAGVGFGVEVSRPWWA